MIRHYFSTRQCSCPNCKDNHEVAWEQAGSCFGHAGQSPDFNSVVNIWSHINLKRTGTFFNY